eukprot:4517995-Amphidinium_carterae.1
MTQPEVEAASARYSALMGAPPAAHECTADQLATVKATIRQQLTLTEQLKRTEFKGPSSFEQWANFFRLLKTALISLGEVTPARMDRYCDLIQKYATWFGPDHWSTIVNLTKKGEGPATLAREWALEWSQLSWQPKAVQHLPGHVNMVADWLLRCMQPGLPHPRPQCLEAMSIESPTRRTREYYKILRHRWKRMGVFACWDVCIRHSLHRSFWYFARVGIFLFGRAGVSFLKVRSRTR